MFCSSWGSYRFFSWIFYIPTIEKLSFNLVRVRILGSMEYGKTRNDCFNDNASKNNIKLSHSYSEKLSKNKGIEIKS